MLLPLAQAKQYGIKKQGGIGNVLGNSFGGGGGECKGKHDKPCFYFGEGCIFRVTCWGNASCSKNINISK